MIGEANELRSLHPEMKKISNLRQSHYREVPRWEILYETGIEIWAGFGPVGITEKKTHLGQLFATFEAGFFKFSWAKININNILSALKSSIK